MCLVYIYVVIDYVSNGWPGKHTIKLVFFKRISTVVYEICLGCIFQQWAVNNCSKIISRITWSTILCINLKNCDLVCLSYKHHDIVFWMDFVPRSCYLLLYRQRIKTKKERWRFRQSTNRHQDVSEEKIENTDHRTSRMARNRLEIK